MSIPSRFPLLALTFAIALSTFGCHAQTPPPAAAGKPLPPNVAFRVESLLRQKANLPPESTIHIVSLGPSKTPGFQRINISFSNSGHTSKPIEFLLSDDTKTLEQVTSFDIAADPRTLVSPAGRPSRGGPANAPVVIVGFDDLECPFCARLNDSIFPALTQRYGDKVHFVYKDFPLDIHPWAMRAAVDVNCLAAESPTGYWDAVDYIHAHAEAIGSDPKDPKANRTLPRAEQQLDTIVREQATKQHVDMTPLNACIAKQDTTGIEASKQVGQALNVQSTPTLFINGDKIEGAVPLEFIFHVIDNALRAEGVTPPPPYVPPTPPAAAPGQPAASSGK